MVEPGSEPTVEVFLGTASEAIAMAEDALETAVKLNESGFPDKAIAVLIGAVFILVHQVNDLAKPTKAERAGMC